MQLVAFTSTAVGSRVDQSYIRLLYPSPQITPAIRTTNRKAKVELAAFCTNKMEHPMNSYGSLLRILASSARHMRKIPYSNSSDHSRSKSAATRSNDQVDLASTMGRRGGVQTIFADHSWLQLESLQTFATKDSSLFG
ncbi:hypothetical protein Daesc_006362 [Daldinia eschscholtzii]|uniref:Uncharacterized protein n=1 Tax=Daldinia eschscholtzii TaxID=292717 RepID=A0AAX6MHE2_9PEZI